MTPAEIKVLWDQVKANSARLKACAGPHVFVDITPEKPIGKRHRCSACGGEIDSIQLHWYEIGLEHGRKEGAS